MLGCGVVGCFVQLVREGPVDLVTSEQGLKEVRARALWTSGSKFGKSLPRFLVCILPLPTRVSSPWRAEHYLPSSSAEVDRHPVNVTPVSGLSWEWQTQGQAPPNPGYRPDRLLKGQAALDGRWPPCREGSLSEANSGGEERRMGQPASQTRPSQQFLFLP